MFSIHCPGHGSRVLLGPRSIESLSNTRDGVVLHWRCRCGTTGTEPMNPARNPARPSEPVRPAA